MDPRRLICPILPGGCNLNGRSLPHAPLSGCSTTANATTSPANVGQPLYDEEWHQRAIREDQQAAGLLPTVPRGGPILHGCYARAERAYKDWKGAIDDMWADEHHRLFEAQAARARQEEAARRTQLLHEQDARARQVARRQQLLNEEAARARQEEAAARARQEEATARARQEEAARARQEEANARAAARAWEEATARAWEEAIARAWQEATARARQEEATARARQEEATARARQEEATARARQEEAARARQEEANARAAARAREEATARARQEATARQRLRLLSESVAERERRAIDDEARHQWRMAKLATAERAASAVFEAAMAKLATAERHRHAAVLAAEADNQRRHEAVLAADADNQRRHDAVLVAEADERRRHEAVLAAEAADEQRQDESAATVIERIQTEFALCAAPLDAILVEIACEESRHHEEVLAAETVGRRYEAAARTVESEALTLVRRHEADTWASLSTVSPLADKRSSHDAAAGGTALAKLALAVRPRARPRHRTGRRNIPRAPSCFVEVAPTHPEVLQGGLPTPTSTMLAHAISPCRSVVSLPIPVSTTPHTPSLHPFTIDDGTLLSSWGGNGHPFRERGLPLPPWKRTRRKYRPHCTCRRHQPRAPNQSTRNGWA